MLPPVTINDPLAQKALRFLLLFQVIVFVPVLIISFTSLAGLAFFFAIILLAICFAVLTWVRYRYQNHPLVQEKHALQAQSNKLKSQIQAETESIQANQQKRQSLSANEKDELSAALQSLQKDHIQTGLKSVSIADARIPGIGPKLKERLAMSRLLTAADIGSYGSLPEGFGHAKSQALFAWRNAIYHQFDLTKPLALPTEQADVIKKKFQTRHAANDTSERQSEENKAQFTESLNVLQPRIEQLAPLTFTSHISHTLAPQGALASIMIFFLLASPFLLGTTTTIRALVASIPTRTPTPTLDMPATQTQAYKTAIYRITLSAPPPTHTITFTVTITPTATITHTPAPTDTASPTNTSTPIPTLVPVVATSLPSPTGCIAAYPDFCITRPRLTCDELGRHNFTVLPPDPLDYDRDNDGIGCES